MGRILSAIDIGSNTVHLLVGEVNVDGVRKIQDSSEWLSLGEMVGRDRIISPALQQQLVLTLNTFKQLACENGAEGVYVFATEAIRKSSNTKEVLKLIQKATGLTVDVVSGRREAELGLRGALLDTRSASFLLADVGGGSAQIARCTKKRMLVEESFPLGTGTLIAKLGLSSPCDYVHQKKIEKTVKEAFEKCEVFGPVQSLVASGGVARGLWRALHPDGDREIHREEIDYLIWATRRLTVEEIVLRFNVKTKRASTLLPGAVVYKKILERAGHDTMTISRFSVREGALLEMVEGKVEACPV